MASVTSFDAAGLHESAPTAIDADRRASGQSLERDPGMPTSTWRLRSDAWEYLRFAIKRLESGHETASILDGDGEIARNLRALETLELYWAGFGQRYVAEIREALDNGEYSTALERIGRLAF